MPKVLIVGGGAAGMAAATRLLERGFDVHLLEQNDFLGGKLGTHACPELVPRRGSGDMHEHCYHMYLNWYHNFWSLMDEIGTISKWMPMPMIGYRRPGATRTAAGLTNAGSLSTVVQNMMSGVASPADMFLYSYALIDLLGQPSGPGSQLEQTSVANFLNGRGYSTTGSTAAATRTLAEAFASPSYLSSTRSYQSLVKYGFRHPVPSMWLLTENTETGIFDPWKKYLEQKYPDKFKIEMHRRVDALHVQNGNIVRVTVSALTQNTTIKRGHSVEPVNSTDILVDDIILAVPPGSLGRLVSKEISAIAPGLAGVRKLRSEPMISLDLYFKRRLPEMTKSITVLLDSAHNLTLLDTSLVWNNPDGKTFLNVIASDADTLVDYRDEDIRDILLDELARFLPFKLGNLKLKAADRDDDVDYDRTHTQTNVGEELFVNQVGSWEYRPTAICPIDNLFIAGDFCQSFIDVVTIEGAVVTGLLAAEAVRAKHGIGAPIEIVTPESYPPGLMAAVANLARPAAFAAKAVSMAESGMRGAFSRLFPNG